MESTAVMGEADETICKEKSTDDVCVNGNVSCDENDEEMEVDSDEIPTKAPIKKLEVENHKVPNDEKVPNMDNEENGDEDDDDDEGDEESNDNEKAERDEGEEESMDVDEQTNDYDREDENEDGVSQDDDKSQDSQSQDKSELGEITDSQDKNDQEDDEDDDDDVQEIEDNSQQNGKEMTNGTGTENSLNDSDINMEEKMDDSVEIVENKKDSELDSSDVVVIEGDNEHKENGDKCNSSTDEVINLSDKETNKDTPSPSKKKVKKPVENTGPPRRSSRNLNKSKSYIEEKQEEESDIEEVVEVDPLADPLRDDKENTTTQKKKIKPNQHSSSSTIVVNDTKRLVEIAANSKQSNSTSGKKEPTLVIIDTNSILSGRGPVPVAPKPQTISTTSFSMMPVALPAQGVYPPNMRATITPIPIQKSTPPPAPKVAPEPAPILPSLTDDMFVVEAPSFIVPYVYEKPPTKPFKEFIAQMAKEIEEAKKKAEEEAKKKAEEKEKQKKEKGEGDESNDDEEDEEEDKDKDEKTEKKDEESDSKENAKEDDKKESTGEKKEDKSDDVQIIESKKEEIKTIDLDEVSDEKKSNSYFDGPLGSFFINIGFGLVQEYVQTDLLKQQKRKNQREGNTSIDTKMAINSLMKNLEYSKENNEPFRLEQRKCEFCSFKTESNLVLAHHLETPHMRNYVYKCNFCPLEVRSPHDILFHMEAEHNIRGRLERAPAFHQCPNCPYEDNQKGKLSRHLINCLKKFKPEKNLDPPQDWEPPAKIPRIPRVKQTGIAATAATYQALAAQQKNNSYQLYKKLQQTQTAQQALFNRGRGRPTMGMGQVNPVRPQQPIIRSNMMYRPGTSGGSVLVPTSYQFSGNQVFQVVGGGGDVSTPVGYLSNLSTATNTMQNSNANKSNSGKSVQQPSISITPLPRAPAGTTITKATPAAANSQNSDSKPTFVICEICDGYIKDLEQLRNHMQWIHKVKIHPKMIYNRPPLNCQKCQFRFFTDQGLERHLLGSHGLVTSSMQEAANKSKDAGRCPVCGRVYQWKLLNHVARDHNMTLKPAHLSYKCTVCTATFGMYKQFENHVYSAHSVVAKRVMEKKAASPTTNRTSTNDSLLKPLKINDEITIIPQPAKAKNNSASNSRNSTSSNDRGK